MITPQKLSGAYLITGPSGVGKTSIAQELHGLGYNVKYAAQLCHFVDGNDQEAAKPWKLDNAEWLSAHRWVFNQNKISCLFRDHKIDHIFIEGVAAEMDEYVVDFRSVFYLHLDEDMLASRINADKREDRYGKEDFQLQEIILGAENLKTWVQSIGGHIIDAKQSPKDLAKTILNIVTNEYK